MKAMLLVGQANLTKYCPFEAFLLPFYVGITCVIIKKLILHFDSYGISLGEKYFIVSSPLKPLNNIAKPEL